MGEKDQPHKTTNKQPHSGCAVNAEMQDNFISIQLTGEIDLGSSPKIYSLILQQCKQADKSIIIDLENIMFMDSSGLQILLRLREKLLHYRRQILLVNPKPQIRKLFRLTGCDKIFKIFDDFDQALAFLKLEDKQND